MCRPILENQGTATIFVNFLSFEHLLYFLKTEHFHSKTASYRERERIITCYWFGVKMAKTGNFEPQQIRKEDWKEVEKELKADEKELKADKNIPF